MRQVRNEQNDLNDDVWAPVTPGPDDGEDADTPPITRPLVYDLPPIDVRGNLAAPPPRWLVDELERVVKRSAAEIAKVYRVR